MVIGKVKYNSPPSVAAEGHEDRPAACVVVLGRDVLASVLPAGTVLRRALAADSSRDACPVDHRPSGHPYCRVPFPGTERKSECSCSGKSKRV